MWRLAPSVERTGGCRCDHRTRSSAKLQSREWCIASMRYSEPGVAMGRGHRLTVRSQPCVRRRNHAGPVGRRDAGTTPIERTRPTRGLVSEPSHARVATSATPRRRSRLRIAHAAVPRRCGGQRSRRTTRGDPDRSILAMLLAVFRAAREPRRALDHLRPDHWPSMMVYSGR